MINIRRITATGAKNMKLVARPTIGIRLRARVARSLSVSLDRSHRAADKCVFFRNVSIRCAYVCTRYNHLVAHLPALPPSLTARSKSLAAIFARSFIPPLTLSVS